jgi:CheY-like chemotaxis protein
MLEAGRSPINHVPLTILIIDDSPEDRQAVRHYLSEAGLGEGIIFGYCEAGAGKDGLAACRAQTPDCILLDYFLPDMSGLDFLAQLMHEADELPLPVVMLTGATDRTLAAAALQAGAQEYLPKRFMGPEMLIRAVQSSRSRFSLLADRRRGEAALIASEKMLRLSQEAGGIASFEHDFHTGVIHWAAGSQTLLGFAATEATITSADWFASLDPGDAVRILMPPLINTPCHYTRPSVRENNGCWSSSRVNASISGCNQRAGIVGIMS